MMSSDRLRALGARSTIALALLLLAAGCASAPCAHGETIALRLSPHKQLNQDRDGYPRSVVLRLYQIDSAERFRAIGFDTLWQTPDTGTPQKPVVVTPEQLTVIPGKRESRTLARAPAARFVAVVANFREHRAGSGWQAIAPLPKPKNACAPKSAKVAARLTVELEDYGLQLR